MCWIVFAPSQLEAFKVQFIESKKQVLRPLVAVTAFPQAVINEKIIEDWRAKHAVFSPEPANSDERTVSQQLCFVTIYSGLEGSELVGQFLGIGRIIF